MSRFSNFQILSGNMSASQVSDVIKLNHKRGFSLQFVHSGSDNTGSFSIQYSNDGDERLISNWTTYDDSTITLMGQDSYFMDVDQVYAKFARVNYTVTQGTGSIIIRSTLKGDL